MKERHDNYNHTDPFDTDTLYTDIVGGNTRVFMHKIVSRKAHIGSQGKLVLLNDSERKREDDELIVDLSENPILYTHDSGTQEIHTHARAANRHIFTYRNPWYPGQSLFINAVMQHPNGNEK